MRAALLLIAGLTGLLLACGRSDPKACEPWSAWQAYKTDFLSTDGRVVADSADGGASVSEGQAYALFFALVADDRETFRRILAWTENNLAAGDLTARLPAWRWGRKTAQDWGVLDDNSAADADLWLAYTLHESGVLWSEARYSALARLLGERVLREETAELPGLGLTLLPGPRGFELPGQAWRLNPSYSPVFVLRRLAAAYPDAGWPALLASSRKVIAGSAPKGFAPDWIEYAANAGFRPDEKTAGAGSYDAIRVYLWAGLLPERDAIRAELLAGLRPMAQQILAHGMPPESVDTRSGETRGDGPEGFSAALVPFLAAAGETQAADSQAARVAARPPEKTKTAYYNRSLALFGLGWKDGRYRIEADGALNPVWHSRPCPARA